MAELIVGFGEIGKAVKAAICPDALVHDIQQSDENIDQTITIMHICFPYSEHFVQDAKEYIERWQPEYIAIWSTLPIGTTKLVGPRAVHTPVEGRHPKLARSIRLLPRWLGYNQPSVGAFFRAYFEQKHLRTHAVQSSDYTEALKLLSTTEYGINLVYADYKKRVADAIGMDYELCKQFNRDYNQLYRELGLNQFQKFVLDPPNGVIGGHCVRENSILLNEQYPDTLLDRISGMSKPQGGGAWASDEP